jgi:predicted nucleic acid-binding protein
MTLVDTNVVIDVVAKNPTWLRWSAEQLERAGASGQLWINEIVYAELAAHIETEADLQFVLGELRLRLARTPVQALFNAGRAFRSYRRAGGLRTSVLPDFFIGAHAQVSGLRLLTRDPRRYRSYFPEVELITPEV